MYATKSRKKVTMSSKKPQGKKTPLSIPKLTVSFEDIVNFLGGPHRKIFSDRWHKTDEVAEILDRPNSCIKTVGTSSIYDRAFVSFERTCRKHAPDVCVLISQLRTHVNTLLHSIRGLAEKSAKRLEITSNWLREMIQNYGFSDKYEIPFPWLNQTPTTKSVTA